MLPVCVIICLFVSFFLFFLFFFFLSTYMYMYSAYRMALIFCGSLFSRISRIWRRSRNYFNEIFEPKGIITRAPRCRALSASMSSLNRELKAARSNMIMLKIPYERGDHARLLQPRELARVTACAKAAYCMLRPYYRAWARSTQRLRAWVC